MKSEKSFKLTRFVAKPRSIDMRFQAENALVLAPMVNSLRTEPEFDAFCLQTLEKTEQGIACEVQLRFK